MHVAQPRGEPVQELTGHAQRRIDLMGVSDVQAQSRLRQRREERSELIGGPPARLASIHVLDYQRVPQPPVGRRVRDRVRMDDDRIDPAGDRRQLPREPGVVEARPLEGAWTLT